MWSEKSMARSGIKGFNILIAVDMKTLAGNTYQNKYKVVTATLKLINKTAYNELIIYQEDVVCFQIVKKKKETQ